MKNAFFIVGPTAAGKSELAAEVAATLGGEIVNADAFQIYGGLKVLTAHPDAATLRQVPHHLLGEVPATQEMNVERFRRLALARIDEIRGRGKVPVVTGGSGLYLKALTHGLSTLPAGNTGLRTELDGLTNEELQARLLALDPAARNGVDLKNRRRVLRALEICLLTGKPASGQRHQWQPATGAPGVFVFRERDELHTRINRRVENMFANGVVEEVKELSSVSSTAAKAIGFLEIRALLEGKISQAESMALIQQATRRYAKRQLTWFRGQSSFEPLNLSPLSYGQAVERIIERARRSFVEG